MSAIATDPALVERALRVAGAATLIATRDGSITWMNDAAATVLGHEPAAMRGRPLAVFCSAPDTDRPFSERWQDVIQGTAWTGTLILHGADGTRTPKSATLTPVPDADMRVSHAMVVLGVPAGSVSEADELRERNRALKRSNEELELFAHTVAHDLREPLRMVSSYVQLIEKRYKGELDSAADDFIHFAVDGADRMSDMIASLLCYAKVDAHGRSPRPVRAAVAVSSATQNLSALIADAKGHVDVGTLPTVRADLPQLIQLFQNLIANALTFRGDATPQIRVAAARNGAAPLWTFSVSDNGIGVATEHAERVFGAFQRLNARTEYPGTGMGLALCRRIVQRHGGTIWIPPSEEASGTTICFTLPDAGHAA